MKLNKNCILLFLFCLALYGTFSGLIPLLDPDEPVYGETAKEMLSTGDWLSPRIYGEFWYDKPPLFYWLESISFTLFGVSTTSARLPSILMGALLSPYLYLSMRKLVGEKAALYGAFISASSLEIIVLARSSVTDATLTFTLTVALISFLRKEYIPAYIFCGLSLLAKGPIGFGFPALIVGLWMIFRGSFTFKNIMALGWTWGIPLACLVGLPWYLAMGMIHGDAFIDTFLGYHNVTRFISPEHAGQNHYWLYLVVLIAGFGETGAQLALALDREGIATVALDLDPKKIERAEMMEFVHPPVTLAADASDPNVLLAAGFLLFVHFITR